ncbi:hypothetical protein B296_00006349 [Ensete ventricosum]|uniref:Uncharacterized protein n=1 Tax=Ensete ventricosum TaxID=4639 RepID=A0A427AHE3_ENSVE|nr:hypothetical protein B296_00006349 [Ensete ventricosum]
MRLGTRQECIGSSPRVSGACQDGAREFTRRRPRLAERLSGVAEKLAESLTMTGSIELQPDNGPGFGRCGGFHREFARRFAEGIGNLTGNMPGEDQKTYRKYAGGYRIGGS